MIYNDAYAVVAGNKHPGILGAPVLEGWKEVASFNQRVMQSCYHEGGTLTFKDQYLTLDRNGSPEDAWLDLYYSPIHDENGKPCGVMAIVVETTKRIMTARKQQAAEEALRASEERIKLSLEASEMVGTWDWDIVNDKVVSDERFATLFLLEPAEAALGVPIAEYTKAIHPDDQLLMKKNLETLLQDGTAPSLSATYIKAMNNLKIGENSGSCGTAAHTLHEVIVTDIAQDILWTDFRDLALAEGLLACWSMPIITSTGELLGTFALYYNKKRGPTTEEREVVKLLSQTAALVIERQRDTHKRAVAEKPGCGKMNHRLRLLSALDEATRHVKDPVEVMAILTRLIGSHFNASRCAYADIEPNGDNFTIYQDYLAENVLTTKGEYSLNSFGEKAFTDLHAGRTLVICNLDAEITQGVEMFRAIDAQALICCPLVKEGQLTAMMAIHSTKSRDWTAEEIDLFEAATARSWAVVERARADKQLRKSEESFRQLANAMPQVVWSADAEGHLDYVNDRCTEYSGEIALDNGRVDWTAIIYPDDIERTILTWKKSIASGEPYQIHQRIYHKDSDQYRWNLSLALPAHDETGAIIIRWFGTNTDIEDQKRAAEELIKARDASKAANITKSEFLANMSHEIRTPMNAIIGLAHILGSSQPLTRTQQEYLGTLQMSANTLLGLINDLLDIAKIEAHTVTLEQIPFDLTQVTQEVISMVSVRAREKGLSFTVDAECAENRIFLGDSTRLRQIILNLCSNAVKFTEQGSVHISIDCAEIEDSDKEMISISVKDTGIGIAPEKLTQIFDKFVQADTSINRKYGGTGLGLAITKTLSGIMGGTIDVESETGKGSVFTLHVPLKPLESSSEPVCEVINDPQSQAKKKGNAMKTVLLVEDYIANILVAGTYLEQFGYAYDVANDGVEAIEKIKTTEYAAALMDVQMHGMNGLEATQKIRELEKSSGKTRPLPIIGMTAHALTGDRERCIAAGMDEYLPKPFNPNELKALLEKLTG